MSILIKQIYFIQIIQRFSIENESQRFLSIGNLFSADSILLFDFSFVFSFFIQVRTRSNLKWKPNAQTIAGGNRGGDKLNQLNYPHGIYVDHQQQRIYIADHGNHRVVKWKLGENNGQIVAGENGKGNRIDQLNCPTDVIVDESNKSLIICDSDNSRIVRWPIEHFDNE